MTHPQLKTLVGTKVMTRNALLQDTANRFLKIAQAKGEDVSFFDPRLELMIRNQFTSELTIVVSRKGKTVGGVGLAFDWGKHEHLCVTIGEDVDMSDLDEGDTFASIQAALDAAQTYVDGLFSKAKATSVETWFTFNPVEEAKYGRAEMLRILDIKTTPEIEAATAAAWNKIRLAMDRSRHTSHSPKDQKEAVLYGFKCGRSS